MSSLSSPERVWWKPLSRTEGIWVTIAVIWGIIMFVMMFAWHAFASQQIPVETYKVEPQQFQNLANTFITKYQVGTEKGTAIVRPPAGVDVYLVAKMWRFDPILELKKGTSYRIHTSSMDLQHGLSIQPQNLNFMILPGYDYVLTLTPDKAGTYEVVCNEFCGPGHHIMVGKIIVTE